jgi:phosphohistidine phosphatase
MENNMKTLVLIRHAKSSWDHMGLKDIDRPLNEKGHESAVKMSNKLAAILPKIDQIISSPAVRAHTTAQYFATAYHIEKEAIELDSNIYEAVPEDIINIIQEVSDANNAILIFGHNPTFTYLANMFNSDFIDNVPTCGICIIQSKADKWLDFNTHNSTLIEFLRPSKFED